MDSDFEAFSHYPADGSFTALPCQTAAKAKARGGKVKKSMR